MKTLRTLARTIFDGLFSRSHQGKITLGERCPWTIIASGLGQDSIVYSGGVGEDVSFELELIERFGMQVHCFDPSPVGAETAETAGRKDRRLIFRAVGLAATASPLSFETTDQQPGTMHHWYKPTTKSSAVAVAECTTIPEEMYRNGHSHIDLLKLDIEGFEYEVLESCLDAGIRPRQICVELHHFFPNFSWKQTVRILWRLRRSGYRLMHKHYYDYTLIRA